MSGHPRERTAGRLGQPNLVPRAGLAERVGYHSPQIDVDVRLNSNESPVPAPSGWSRSYAKALRTADLHRYPDRRATELRQRLATHHGVRPEQVFVANGSNEVLLTLLLAYGGPGRRAALFEPTYAMHSRIAALAGTEVIDGGCNRDFTIDFDALPTADITFLCSPNNPTGTLHPVELARAALGASALVVVDEAYAEFADAADEGSALTLVDDDTPLVVTRTFSKTWALAGVRLGYLIGPVWLVQTLWQTVLPYHLSTPAQVAGVLALDYADAMHERVATIAAERARVVAALEALPITTWPSAANFILIRPQTVTGEAVWRSLVSHSVLVRNCASWPKLDGCLRVTIGTPDENNRFLDALRASL